MKKNLFVTAVGGDIACSTLRCIRRHYPCNQIIGCDIQKYVQGLDYVDTFILAPTYENEKIYLDFIEETCLKYEITHFLPMTEAEILIAHHNRELFKKHGILLMINNGNIIDIALSKYNTAKYLLEIGVASPNTFKQGDYDNQLTYPLVVKADYGRGSKDVFIVSNDMEYKYALSQVTNPIIQEYIGSKDEEYTMGIFSDGDKVKEITFKRKLGFGGMSVCVECVSDNKLTKIASQIADSMHLIGSLNVQMRKSDDTYYVFEINPRLSSTVGFRDLFGFNDVIWWLNILDGDKPDLDSLIHQNIVGIKILNETTYLTSEPANAKTIYSGGAEALKSRKQ